MASGERVPTLEDTKVETVDGNGTRASNSNLKVLLRSNNRAISSVLYVAGAVVVVLGLWEGAVRAFDVATVILPAPSDVGEALFRHLGLYLSQLLYTVKAIALGFCMGAGAAVLVAILVTEVELFRRTVYPLAVAFHSMPLIGLAPIFVVWFGFGTQSHAALASLIAFFPVFMNMAHGLEVMSREQVSLLRSYRANRLQMLIKLKLPSSLPFFFAGADIGLISGMLGVIVAEFLGSNAGMGFLLIQLSNNLDTSGVFGVLFILAVVGLMLHGLLLLCRRKILHWNLEQ